MSDPQTLIALSGAGLAAMAMVSWSALRGWHGWLELKRLELGGRGGADADISPSPSARIDIADLKERVRKLESIAAGVDL